MNLTAFRTLNLEFLSLGNIGFDVADICSAAAGEDSEFVSYLGC